MKTFYFSIFTIIGFYFGGVSGGIGIIIFWLISYIVDTDKSGVFKKPEL